MAGINVNGIGRNPYADSYLTSAKKQKEYYIKRYFCKCGEESRGK